MKLEFVILFVFPFEVDNQWRAWVALSVRPCRWGAIIEYGREEGPYIDVYL
jgi:hypothetical protein